MGGGLASGKAARNRASARLLWLLAISVGVIWLARGSKKIAGGRRAFGPVLEMLNRHRPAESELWLQSGQLFL